MAKHRSLARTHILPSIGARKLRELSADDVDRWLAAEAKGLSTDSLRHCPSSCAARSPARRPATRSSATSCSVRLPTAGRDGRPSNALTLGQAAAVLDAAEGTPIYAYIALSILIGARLRSCGRSTWDHVDLDGASRRPARAAVDHGVAVSPGRGQDQDPQVPPHAQAPAAVRGRPPIPPRAAEEAAPRSGGGVARPRSRVRLYQGNRAQPQQRAALIWKGHYHQDDPCRRRLDTREMRHSFVSLLSDSAVPDDKIAQLVATPAGSQVTETVYLKQIRPVLLDGADAMDRIFTPPDPQHPALANG